MALPPLVSDGAEPVDSMTAATAQIRSYCGWHVAPVIDETVVISTFGGRSASLPTRRIVEVMSVSIDGVDVTEKIDWDEGGVITLRSGSFPDRSRAVTVNLRHGFDTESVADAVAVAEQVAARINMGRRNGGDIVQQTAGPFGMRRQARLDGQVGGVGFFASERATLDRYRLTGGLV